MRRKTVMKENAGKCRQRATLSRARELKYHEFRVVQCLGKCTISILGVIFFVDVFVYLRSTDVFSSKNENLIKFR